MTTLFYIPYIITNIVQMIRIPSIRKKKPVYKNTLPNQLLALPNADKAFHEEWDDKRDMLNIPHPFRAVLLGPPNTGKSTTVKNMVIRQEPPFEEICVIHCDAEHTKEYDDLGDDVKMMSLIPAPQDWEGLKKTLVIIDDLELKTLPKDQKRNLDRLFGYVSTHKNISVCLCSQDPFNVPPIVRRCSNLWVLWKCNDIDSMSICARKTGLKSDAFNSIFNDLLLNKRDSLWIDLTNKTPYGMRKNGYTLIHKKDGEDSRKEELKRDKYLEDGRGSTET